MLKQILRLLGFIWLLFIFIVFLSTLFGSVQKSALIAFLTERNRDIDIVLADSESAINLSISNNSNREDELMWSADGRYLSFNIADVPDSEIWLFDTHDGSFETIDLGESSYYFWYSATELLIHINRSDESHLLNIETGIESPLSCKDCQVPYISMMSAYDLQLRVVDEELIVAIDKTAYLSSSFEPNVDLQPWSPDEQAFLFITALQGQPDIYLSPASGGIARRLTNTITPEQSPRWSADGQKIAYVSYEAGNPEIYVLELATGYHYNISRQPNRDDTPVWQPFP